MHGRYGGTGNHRQHLQQGAKHDLAEKPDDDQVRHGQGSGGPTGGKDRLSVEQQYQGGRKQEQRCGQKKAER